MSRKAFALGLAFLALATAPLVAQDRAVVFQALAGGYSHTRNLNITGVDAHFKLGYAFDAGIGVQFNKYVALVGEAGLARSKGLGAVTFVDQIVNRYFLGGRVELKYPFEHVTPYVFGGGGALRVDEQGKEATEDFQHFTRGAVEFGGGLNLALPASPLGILAEAKVMNYKWVASPYQRYQWDVMYGLGVSYKLGF